MRIWAMHWSTRENIRESKGNNPQAGAFGKVLVRLNLASITETVGSRPRKLADILSIEDLKEDPFSIDGLVWNRATNQGRSGQSTTVGEKE